MKSLTEVNLRAPQRLGECGGHFRAPADEEPHRSKPPGPAEAGGVRGPFPGPPQMKSLTEVNLRAPQRLGECGGHFRAPADEEPHRSKPWSLHPFASSTAALFAYISAFLLAIMQPLT